MSEMVTRVAKAIYYATPHKRLYTELSAAHVRYWEKRAELAIMAMRDPTEEMLFAADWLENGTLGAWQAMIDIAPYSKANHSTPTDGEQAA